MTSRLIRARKKPFVTVGHDHADYVVNGAADNVQIQAAVDFVNAAGGGTVYIKRGTYNLAAQVSIQGVSNVEIIGDGVGATVLENYGIRKNDTGVTSNMVFRDFTIDIKGNTVQAMSFVNNSYFFQMQRVELKNADSNFLLQWGGCDRLIVENCYFYDGGLTNGKDNAAGTQLVTTDNTSVFRNCWFVKELSAGGGLLTTGQTGNFLVDGCSFVDLSNNSYAAISCEQQEGDSKNVKIANCHSYRLGFQFGVSANSNRLAKGSIINCMVEGVPGANAGQGITTQRVDDLTISNVTLSDTVHGIFSKDNGYVKILHNKIRNTDSASSGAPGDKAGVWLTGNTSVDVIDNTIWDDQDTGTTPYGIRIAGGSQKVYLDNNKCYGPFTNNALQTTATQTQLNMTNNDFSGGSISLGTITNLYADNNININPKLLHAQGNVTGATTFTRVNGNHITATLTGNITTTITNGLVKGDMLTLELTQDGTGSRTISKPANVKLVGGAFSPTATAGATDIWKLQWDGADWVEVSRSLNVS